MRIASVLGIGLALALSACGDDNPTDPDAGIGDPDAAVNPDATAAPDAGPQPAVVVCPDPVPAAQTGVCDATAGSGSAVLLRGTVLGAGTVYENGSVLYDGDHITCVGCDCSGAAGFDTATRVDCAGAVISPGLINPHDHLRYTEGAPIDHGTTRYDHRHDWRGSLPAPQNPHGTGGSSAGMRWGELRQLLAGTTSLIGSGGADGLVRNLDDLLGADQALGFEEVHFETFSLGDANEQFRANCSWSYSDSEDRVAEMPLFMPHVAEGINSYAAEEFRCQSSSFVGRDFTEKNTSHIHSIGLRAVDYFNMSNDEAKLIWAPRSNISLYGMTADVVTFHRLGGTLAMGTDWTYTGSVNILRELACADSFNRDHLDGYFTDEDLWKMVTIGAAIAAGADSRIGSLEAGKIADIAVFSAAPGEHHRAVITADNADVVLVVRDGDPLYGESDTLSSLGAGCETITVCGQARSVCAQSEFGVTYASIESAVAGAYPAIFCGVPAGEPTCTPSRPGEFSGITSGDMDGDGVPDASDNCPRVFNPIRPIDGTQQPDADGDGIGDPCDPTPLPSDLDGDFVPNTADNCPFDANTNQADSDTDTKGNVCDFCPDAPNPDTGCPSAPPPDHTIYEVQMGTVGIGTRVSLRNVIVTSRFASGATVQDPAGGAYSGIYIFTGGNPGVAVGDLVDVEGEVEEYFGNTELEFASITRLGAGTPITPASLTAATAATEAYEGVLVTVTDAALTNPAYDCGVLDNPLCTDDGLWEINGSIVVYDFAYEATDWSTHIGEVPVTGVMMYRFDRRRIMPRTAADFP